MSRSPSELRQGTSGDIWEKGARAGYAVSGVLHIVLGFLIAQIALGERGEEASSSEALSTLGESAFGAIILWAAVVAFVALATWQFADAIRPQDSAKDRMRAVFKAGVNAVLALSAANILMGSSGGGGDSEAQGLVGIVLEWPGGQILVGAAALGIFAAGVFHIVKGAKKRFLEELKAMPPGAGPLASRLGMAGYIAKGVALAVVGALIASAAVNADANEAAGIDGALTSLLDLPGGPVMVVVVGVGFAAYGLYSFVRVRYARM